MNWIERKLLEMEIKKMLAKISWRTTTWGILGILSTIAGAVYHFHTTGQFDFDATLKTVVGIAGSCGLIAAADNKNLPPAKMILLVLGLLCFTVPSRAQTPAPPANIYAAGVSFNNSGSPAIAGTGLYAHLVSDGTGTYAFTAVDALPNSLKPFTVTTNFSAGVAQKVFTIAGVPIFVPSSAGVSYSGSNVGWAWSTGGMASFRIKKTKWRLFPTLRVAKSSVSNGTGVQPIFGLLVGYAD